MLAKQNKMNRFFPLNKKKARYKLWFSHASLGRGPFSQDADEKVTKESKKQKQTKTKQLCIRFCFQCVLGKCYGIKIWKSRKKNIHHLCFLYFPMFTSHPLAIPFYLCLVIDSRHKHHKYSAEITPLKGTEEGHF